MKPVLAVSGNRDIVFGYVEDDQDMFAEKIALKKARTCLWYSDDMRGFTGLAIDGPSDTCRISFELEGLYYLHNVKRLLDVSAKSISKWNAAPWNA
jgi:hypothetical protein